ncbi:peptidase S8/S53 domain-containing protein [Xylaria sp. CBS 124048]|nr:peptidase S8/S53 domain-containing protein [Xylaria sp. CBS 124048]
MRLLGAVPLFFTAALCTPIASNQSQSGLVVHEKRDELPVHWTKVSDASGNTSIPLRIALKQSNLENAEEYMRQVSHPASDKYGQFWTPEQVIAAFAPSDEAVSDTTQWLLDMGVSPNRIAPSAGRNWIKVNSTVAEAEKLLNTTYGIYQDDEGTTLLACESYALPASIQEHIDFVSPTIQFDARMGQAGTTQGPKREALRPKFKTLDEIPDPNNLTTCWQTTTPACLRAIYDMPSTGEAVEGNSFGIFELAPLSYNQEDLNIFFSVYASNVPNDTAPIFDGIDGGFLTNETGTEIRGEPNLDLCYGMGLVYPQLVTLYQVGDNVTSEPATENNFLDAIDGSYCTFEGGDDPSFDGIYPHNATTPGAYTGQPMCGTFNATSVISISYETNEADKPASYQTRQCTEYMKLALMGVTVLFPSGDDGVAGIDGLCLPDPGAPPVFTNPRFNPAFPSTCPWITSVGGSAIPQGGMVGDTQTFVWEFSSGGGFSNVFAMPDYQKTAIAAYYASHDPGYNASHYNNSRVVRGYPDVALSAQDFITGIDGGLEAFSGTSAATPLLGAMITLINGERLKAGKGPVGFLNSVFYEHPEIFDDAVEGHQIGCATDGFSAVEGWDPTTGLGVPNYIRMKDVFMSLP